MIFDPAKIKAIHFSQRRNFHSLDIKLPTLPFAQDPMILNIL